jgi:hypothetical protein
VLYNRASCRSPCNCGEVSPRDVNLRPVLKLGSSASLISHRQPFSTHHLSQGHHIYPLRVPHPSLSATICAHIARGEYIDFTCIPPALSRQPGTSRFACLGLPHSRSAVSRQDFRPSPNSQGTTQRCCNAPVGHFPGVSQAPHVARLSGYWFLATAFLLSLSVARLAYFICIQSWALTPSTCAHYHSRLGSL